MDYVLGAVAGLIFGAAAGYVKYLLVWRKIVKAGDDEKVEGSSLVSRMIISSACDAAILLVVFLLRNLIPLEFITTILGTGVGLAIVITLSPERDIRKKIKEDAS